MKKILAILLIIALGVALGVGVATLRLRAAPWNPAGDEAVSAAAPASTGGEKPAPQPVPTAHPPPAADAATAR